MSKVTDDRFKHVHTDPRFARGRKQANNQSTDQVDDRFSAALTDPSFKTRAPSVDQFGRSLNNKSNNKQSIKQSNNSNKQSDKQSKQSTKPIKQSVKSNKQPVEHPIGDSDDEAVESGNDSDHGKSYLSTREVAPPSSDDDESDQAINEFDDDDEDDPQALLNSMYQGIQTPLADTSDDDDDEMDEIEVEEEEEIEEIPIGQPTRRIAIMNLDWDRLRSLDLYILIRSFLSGFKTETGQASVEQLRSVTVYPSQFGKERLAEEAKYGPIGLYSGDAEKYRETLQAKIDSHPIKQANSDDDSEQSDDSEAESEAEADDEEQAEQEEDAEDAEDVEQNDDDEIESDADEESDIPAKQSTIPTEDEQLLDQEKLRQYELSRLKYYYAIAEFETVKAAAFIYGEIDGVEFESSANKLDLRFVPDEVNFDDDEPRDMCDELTTNELAAYQAPVFTTRALQNSRVELTWDGDDPERKKKMQAKKGSVEDDDLAVYLASDGEDGYGSDALTDAGEMDSDDGEPVRLKRKARSKYKSLLQELAADEDEEGGEEAGEEEEGFSITFEPGLKAKGEEIAAKALEKEKSANETVFEQQLRKQKEKRKLKKKQAAAGETPADAESEEEKSGDDENDDKFDDDLVDVDMNDPFFRDAFDEVDFGVSAADKSKKKAREFFSDDARISKYQKEKNDKAERKGKKAKPVETEALDPSLALLVEDDDGKGYDLKALIKEHKQSSKTGKKHKNSKVPTTATPADKFNVDVADPRFSVLYENPVYSIDPTHPQFKATKGMDELQQERQRRRIKSDRETEATVKAKKAALTGDVEATSTPNLSSLVQSVKAKANALDQAKKARENVTHKRSRGDRDASLPSLQTTVKRARQTQE